MEKNIIKTKKGQKPIRASLVLGILFFLVWILTSILLVAKSTNQKYVYKGGGFEFRLPYCWSAEDELGKIEIVGTCKKTANLSKDVYIKFIKMGEGYDYGQRKIEEGCIDWKNDSNWCYVDYDKPESTGRGGYLGGVRRKMFMTYQNNILINVIIHDNAPFHSQDEYTKVENMLNNLVKSFSFFTPEYEDSKIN